MSRATLTRSIRKADETGGGASSALGHTQPSIKSIGVQDAVRRIASGLMIN